MQKQLLPLFLLSVLLWAGNSTAQDKVWDFGTDTSTWQLNSGYDTEVIIDNIGLVPGAEITNFGEIDSNNATWEDEYKSSQRFKFNGSGGADPLNDNTFIPTKRYLYFRVEGNATVKIWYRKSGGSERTLYVTDGTSIVASATDAVDDTSPKILTATYEGDATTLYIFGGQNSFNLYKIEVTGQVGNLNTPSIREKAATSVKAIGDRVYVTNVSSSAEVNIYNLTGALVHSFKTTEDTSFDLQAGLWLAKVQTPQGQQSVKLLTR